MDSMDPPDYIAGLNSWKSSSSTQFYNFLQVPTIPQVKELENKHLQLFWYHQMVEADHLTVCKPHQLPLARIKRVMKSDKSVKLVSASAPIVMEKACELFIMEMTIRSWLHTNKKEQTLMRSDIAKAVSNADELDFLMKLIKNYNGEGNKEQGEQEWIDIHQEGQAN